MTTTQTPRTLPHRAKTALRSYLEAVAAALNQCGMAVASMEVTSSGELFSGRIHLVRGVVGGNGRPEAVQLRWYESTGWEVALRLHPDQPATPWRFLHLSLAPEPGHVASFTRALLRGEDLGMAYPARFRRPGDDIPTLIAMLTRHSRAFAPLGAPVSTTPGDGASTHSLLGRDAAS